MYLFYVILCKRALICILFRLYRIRQQINTLVITSLVQCSQFGERLRRKSLLQFKPRLRLWLTGKPLHQVTAHLHPELSGTGRGLAALPLGVAAHLPVSLYTLGIALCQVARPVLFLQVQFSPG